MIKNIVFDNIDETSQRVLNMLFDGEPVEPKNLGPGLYQINHFNFDLYLGEEWEIYPFIPDFENPENKYGLNPYGVCDSPEQFMGIYGDFLMASPSHYVVSFTEIRKDTQPSEGGWRWSKWGPYIGKQNHQFEYLHDEPAVDVVYCYCIYEKKEF